MSRAREATRARTPRRHGKRADERGAVLAEFVVVLLPLLTIFFVFLQLSAIAQARLRVKHAAVIGARAAAVFSNSGDNLPEQRSGDGRSEIEAGVKSALGTLGTSGVSVVVNDASSRGDPYGLVTVTVTAEYRCGVPLGKIICPGGTRTLTDTKSMPHQGARYRL